MSKTGPKDRTPTATWPVEHPAHGCAQQDGCCEDSDAEGAERPGALQAGGAAADQVAELQPKGGIDTVDPAFQDRFSWVFHVFPLERHGFRMF